MEDKSLSLKTFETAFLLIQQHALIRLISIIITFLFWFLISFFILILFLFDLLLPGQLLQIHQVLSIFGLSPVLLTLLSWRMIERMCSAYIRKYVSKHLQKS